MVYLDLATLFCLLKLLFIGSEKNRVISCTTTKTSLQSMGDLQKLLQFFSSGYWYEVKLLRVGYTVTGCVTRQKTDGLDLTVVVLVAVGHGTYLHHFQFVLRENRDLW